MSAIYLSITETPAVVTLSQPVISGALSSTVTVANTVTVALDANSLSALEQVTVTIGTAVSISNFPSTQTIAGTVTAKAFGIIDYGDNNYQQAQLNLAGHEAGFGSGVRLGVSIIANDGGEYGSVNLPFRVNGTVTVGNSVTIGSLPAISGTVTANLSSVPTHGVTIANSSVTVNGTFYQATQPVSLASLPSLAAGTAQIGSVTASISGTVPVSGTFWQATQPISGTVTANVSGTVPVSGTFYQATQPVSLASLPSLAAGSAQIGSVTASISGTPTVTMGAISGTVTATIASTTVTVSALPSGALTTRFGSVTTANTAQITTAVTNTSRKYLLCQNISSGTVTIGIGFSPTTTQGIQLTSGAGLTFDSFCPTGAVYWLGATTGANWTILEG